MEERVRRRLTRAEGRRFGLTVGVASLVLGGLLWWRDRHLLAAIAGGLAGLLVLAALLAPARMGPVERAWMALALAISRVTTPIFMALVYDSDRLRASSRGREPDDASPGRRQLLEVTSAR